MSGKAVLACAGVTRAGHLRQPPRIVVLPLLHQHLLPRLHLLQLHKRLLLPK